MVRKTSFSILFLASCSLFTAGCTPTASPVSQGDESTAGTVADAPAGTFQRSGVDLSIPRLAPRPVVWWDDWLGVDAVPPARQEAQELMAYADQLKAAESFREAATYYHQAMQADPTWGYPAYQLACNYELSGQHGRAQVQFARAVELGFDDFPMAVTDDELGRLRDGPDFAAALLQIRGRYVETSKERVGEPIAFRPADPKPDDGWPVMLLLHGYGDTHLSYLDNANEWAELGFVAVAVPGSVPMSSGRYMWAMDSTEPTHQDLQTIIASPLLDGIVNREKVFLLGFSQGALHGMLLTAENPDVYAGVVGLSPGGGMWERLETPPVSRSGRSARCVFIHGEQEVHARFVPVWSDACEAAGWRFASMTHPGSHHFPESWDSIRPKIAAFLIK